MTMELDLVLKQDLTWHPEDGLMTVDSMIATIVEVVVVDVTMIDVVEAVIDAVEGATIAVEMIGGAKSEAKNY